MNRIVKHIIFRVKPILVLGLGFLSFSCVETYDYESEIGAYESALVIEATITDELKTQEILISRTFRLEEEDPSPESGALVKVVDDTNTEYLFEASNVAGIYQSIDAFMADPNREYQLKIITSNGSSYSSKTEHLPPKATIENLNIERGFNDDGVEGISILIDSNSPTGNSRFYRFEYEETYKIIAPRYSAYEIQFIGDSYYDYNLILRPEQEGICYNTVSSNEIIQATTVNLVEDKLIGFTPRFINRDNYIIGHRYSILVKQYVQSREAHSYYSVLKEMSESESLLSQSQPGFVGGNVFADDGQEALVLGYFEVSAVSSKRVYFNYEALFPNEDLPPYIVGCNTFIAPVVRGPTLGNDPPPHPLYDHIQEGFQFYETNNGSVDGDFLIGPELLVLPQCGDCTTLGSNVVPDFWIE